MDLPKALDAALKALLVSHSISSFKVDDSRHSPAVIIRLSPLRVSSVCQDGVHVNTFRRKPPSQVKRDRERMDIFKHRGDRVENQTVLVPDITMPVVEDVSLVNMCKDRCDVSDKKSIVETKVSERDSHVDIDTRSVARAEDTGVTHEEVTDREVSVPTADAGSETATLSTHSAAPAGGAVSKKVTIGKGVASTTRADPKVMVKVHGERREGKNICSGGQGEEETISLEMCTDDSSEWIDVDRIWRDDKTWKKKRHEVNETNEVLRRSRREGRGVRERDRGWDQNR